MSNSQGMQSLKDLKKVLSDQQKPAKKSGFGSSLKAMCPSFLKSSVGSLSAWQWRDIILFTGVVVVMYQYGGEIADSIEKSMPNEENLTKMMEEQQE